MLLLWGGGSQHPSIVNSDIQIENSHLSSDGLVFAADFHGNTRYSSYKNCMIRGGIGISGDAITVEGNTILTGNNNLAIYSSESYSADIRIINNDVQGLGAYYASTFGQLIELVLFANVQKPGTVIVQGNTFSTVSEVYSRNPLLNIISSWDALNKNIKVVVTGNTIKAKHANNDYVGIKVRSGSSSTPLASVTISNNIMNDLGISLQNIVSLAVSHNTMEEGNGVYLENIKKSASIIGNSIKNMNLYGLHGAASPNAVLSIVGNDISENNMQVASTDYLNCNIYLEYWKTVGLSGNTIGGVARFQITTRNVDKLTPNGNVFYGDGEDFYNINTNIENSDPELECLKKGMKLDDNGECGIFDFPKYKINGITHEDYYFSGKGGNVGPVYEIIFATSETTYHGVQGWVTYTCYLRGGNTNIAFTNGQQGLIHFAIAEDSAGLVGRTVEHVSGNTHGMSWIKAGDNATLGNVNHERLAFFVNTYDQCTVHVTYCCD
eukprot:m.45259 g.45259  ORF g.45259 m.45259 type:complete len:494 (+) comp10222_c0_seq3:262-1743(+)